MNPAPPPPRLAPPPVLASRRSPLARVQTEAVAAALREAWPGLEPAFLWQRSTGDRVLDRPLADVGGKGLFVKELDAAVCSGAAAAAVHSLKDVPTRLAPGLVIAATPRRAPVEDVLLCGAGAAGFSALPAGATLGTSSPRRAAQALRANPRLRVVLLRGNVGSRRAAVGLGEPGDGSPTRCDATVLARAGLERLGVSVEAPGHAVLPPEESLPAAGQGAVAVVCREDDAATRERLAPLDDPPTAAAVAAERALVHRLGADCHSPVAVLAAPEAAPGSPGRWRLRARVLSTDGRRCLAAERTCDAGRLMAAAEDAAAELLGAGAAALLAEAASA
ncbi:hydroxymethylbilane synthase [Phycisphaera mikurensis]|uniref:hydroxymethylbilane synthase n=1 Tax=Phycisphaera mikurensis TaxID=547188 RepID=UPI0036F2BE78